MSNLWSHLPNATHIDWVIKSLKSHPVVWSTARIAACDAARDAAWEAARLAARAAARDAARIAAWEATWDAAWEAACDAARDAAWEAACDAILALIAYDDAAKYLDMTSDQLKTWAVLSEEPAAVLLLPAVVAYEKISELELI